MESIFWLSDESIEFPDPSYSNEDGLLAVGGDLSIPRLLEAYRSGVFPWFEEEGILFWYSPDPRSVLLPEELKISKSMRPYLNQNRFDFRINTAFEQVLEGCATVKRKDQDNTWLTPLFQESYFQLHKQGIAISAESWNGDALVGGLYGVCMGDIFVGESMFARESNASKVAFIRLVDALVEKGIRLIDCQIQNPHLESLGAMEVRRSEYLRVLAINEARYGDDLFRPVFPLPQF